MVLPFALVEWKGDPKPDCWQVIKTSQIQANPGDISEGKCVDALWKRDEETSVAEILKLSGECACLISYNLYNRMQQASLTTEWKNCSCFFFLYNSDNKTYLNSVREVEYAKPWREATQTKKRVPVPKKIPDLLTGSNSKKSVAGNTLYTVWKPIRYLQN